LIPLSLLIVPFFIFFVISLFYCFSFNPAEDLFKRLNPGFPIFDLLFFPEFRVDNDEVPDALLKGDDGDYLSYSDLPSRAKAEALMPIIVASSFSLSSSHYKHLLQDIFGRLVFQNRSSLCGFFVTQKGSVSLLTPQATSYLHGRSLLNLMGVPEEAFIRFVIITDFLRYHFDALGVFSKKYRHLLSANDYKNIATLLKEYDEVKALTRPEKGFRNRDIRLRLFGPTPDPDQIRKNGARVSRLLKRLHLHGLIAKIPRTRRWRVNSNGYSIMGCALRLYEQMSAAPVDKAA